MMKIAALLFVAAVFLAGPVLGKSFLPRLQVDQLLSGQLRIKGGQTVDDTTKYPFAAYLSRDGLLNQTQPVLCSVTVNKN